MRRQTIWTDLLDLGVELLRLAWRLVALAIALTIFGLILLAWWEFFAGLFS